MKFHSSFMLLCLTWQWQKENLPPASIRTDVSAATAQQVMRSCDQVMLESFASFGGAFTAESPWNVGGLRKSQVKGWVNPSDGRNILLRAERGNPVLQGRNPAGFSDLLGSHLEGQKTRLDYGSGLGSNVPVLKHPDWFPQLDLPSIIARAGFF